MDSKISKNYIYNLSYQILVLITPLVTTPYISRTLKPEGVGAYSYCYSIETYFALFAALGMQIYGQLKISAVRDDREKVSKFFYQLIITKAITTIISVICYICYVNLFVIENRDIAFILTLNVIATVLDISWFLQALEEFKKTVIRNYIVKLTSLVLIFTLVKNPGDLWKYALVLQGSVLLGNTSLWFGLKEYLLPVKLDELSINDNIRNSLIYFIPNLAITIYSYFDKTMIGLLTHSSAQNGFYEQAFKIENISITIISSLSIVIMPRVAYLYEDKNKNAISRLLNTSSRLIIMLSAPICIGLIAIADTLIPLFLGIDFIESIPILRIFALLIVIDSIKDFFGIQVMMPMKMQRKYNLITVLGVILNLVLNYVFITIFKAKGACVASVISETVIVIAFSKECKEIISLKKILLSSWKYVIAGIVMGLLVYLARFISVNSVFLVGGQILIGVIVYSIVLIVLRDDLYLTALNRVLKR